jgi:very-long-chain (3R)-3-hydroxyacyl-CoA dehydratase
MPPARRQCKSRQMANNKNSDISSVNAIQLYLVAFNVISALGWGYVLILTLLHLFNLDGKAQLAPSPNSASSLLSRFFSTLSLPKVLKPVTVESRFPSYLQPLYQRATTLFFRVGPQTALVQTFAVLEVFHVLFGWVRSPIHTTAMQVSSRLFLVWGITEQFPAVSKFSIYFISSANVSNLGLQ